LISSSRRASLQGIAEEDVAVVVGTEGTATKVAAAFVEAIVQHRNWDRELKTWKNG